LPGYYFFSFIYKEGINPTKALIYSLGLSPILNLLILYYLLFFFSGKPVLFYLIFPLFLLGLLWVFKPKTFLSLKQIKLNYFLIIVLSFIISYLFSSAKTLTEHDTLEYALQGKHFFNKMAVYYTSYPFHPENGFYYIGLHGFTFPLIYTWELMFNNFFNAESIILFKMINPLYSFFLLILVFEEVKTISKTYAFWSVLLIALSMGFIFNALQFHLEMLREFLFLVFVSFFIRALKDASIKNILLFAAIAGLQSTIHSIGAIAACIALALILLKLYLSNMDRKIQTSMFAVLFLLVFGWIHYLLDIFIGTGWILK
jgi:hypothetical protein